MTFVYGSSYELYANTNICLLGCSFVLFCGGIYFSLFFIIFSTESEEVFISWPGPAGIRFDQQESLRSNFVLLLFLIVAYFDNVEEKFSLL